MAGCLERVWPQRGRLMIGFCSLYQEQRAHLCEYSKPAWGGRQGWPPYRSLRAREHAERRKPKTEPTRLRHGRRQEALRGGGGHGDAIETRNISIASPYPPPPRSLQTYRRSCADIHRTCDDVVSLDGFETIHSSDLINATRQEFSDWCGGGAV